MKNISKRGLIIDLDNTLCDTSSGMRHALGMLAEEFSIKDASLWFERFKVINQSLFSQYLAREISLEHFRLERVRRILQSENVEISDRRLHLVSEDITNRMNDSCNLYGDALPFLERAKSKGLKIALLTNGPQSGQWRKINSLGIKHYFDAILISGETGLAKPSNEAFTNALHQIMVPIVSAVMIGDDIKSDILPALSLGMKAYLLNRSKTKIDTSELNPDADVIETFDKIEIP